VEEVFLAGVLALVDLPGDGGSFRSLGICRPEDGDDRPAVL
jgi:hypothetical protein